MSAATSDPLDEAHAPLRWPPKRDNQVLKAEDLTSTTGEDAVGM